MTEEQGKERWRFTPEQKVKVVKEALTTDIGVSGACWKYGISNALCTTTGRSGFSRERLKAVVANVPATEDSEFLME